jgi:predicted regulator of Ras-like GTPase activity (Roadblock/LC7/MglB family)
MTSQEKLEKIVSDVDGSQEAFFCGYDGIMIYRSTQRSSKIDCESFAANCVSSFKHLQDLHEMICYFKDVIIICRLMQDGFLGLCMSLDGNVGRAKMEINKSGSVFIS